jgi:putative ABC transport system ATP-binding protein
MKLLELVGIEKHYHMGAERVPALRGVDLEIRTGEFIALWGPSGSGKSTLCNLAGLIDDPDAGEVSFRGQAISHCDDNIRSQLRVGNIGFVFQSFNLIPVFSALENVLLPLQLRGKVMASMRRQAVELLGTVGLEGELHRRPYDLSGGQQQRVAIARALVANPALVIADEPTANLDTANAHAIIDIMHDKCKSLGTTFLFATHDQRLLGRVERRIHLCDGVIVADHRSYAAQ